MTKTYLIHAWCVRPFITCLYPVEAATPEEAIALARRQPEKLLDAAEECNAAYPWDEFAACDDNGNELLLVLDDQARLREAAPALLEALEGCLYVLDESMEGGGPSKKQAIARARNALAKATAA